MENTKILEIGSWALIVGKPGIWQVESQSGDAVRLYGVSEDIPVGDVTLTVRYPKLSYQDFHPLDLVKNSSNKLYRIQSVHVPGVNCEDLVSGESVFMKYPDIYPLSLDYDTELLREQAGIEVDGMLTSLKNELALREIQGNGAITLSPDFRGLTYYSGTGINIKLANFRYYHEFIKIFNKYKPF